MHAEERVDLLLMVSQNSELKEWAIIAVILLQKLLVRTISLSKGPWGLTKAVAKNEEHHLVAVDPSDKSLTFCGLT